MGILVNRKVRSCFYLSIIVQSDEFQLSLLVYLYTSNTSQVSGFKLSAMRLYRVSERTDMQNNLLNDVMTLTWGQIQKLTFLGQMLQHFMCLTRKRRRCQFFSYMGSKYIVKQTISDRSSNDKADGNIRIKQEVDTRRKVIEITQSWFFLTSMSSDDPNFELS